MTGFLTPTHVLLLLVVVLVLFGAKRLPELGRSLGSGLREFKHSIGAAPTSNASAQPEGAARLHSVEAPPAGVPPSTVAQDAPSPSAAQGAPPPPAA
jgi:sec-independent protein translocase protein TatA